MLFEMVLFSTYLQTYLVERIKDNEEQGFIEYLMHLKQKKQKEYKMNNLGTISTLLFAEVNRFNWSRFPYSIVLKRSYFLMRNSLVLILSWMFEMLPEDYN